jgi:hypothetical protein
VKYIIASSTGDFPAYNSPQATTAFGKLRV